MQIGKSGDLLVPALLPGADKDKRSRIAARHGERFKALYLDHVRGFAGAADLVRKVHAMGRKVVLASSAEQDELDHYVELPGIGDCLAATTSIDDVDVSKPAPDIFSAALERIGIDLLAALVVGDTPYDVEAAIRAGIPAVGLASGPFDEQRMREAGAIAVFADVAELLDGYDRSPLAA